MPHSVRRNELANAAIKLWRGDSESLQYLGDSANYVYSFVHSGKTRYLRLTSSYDRTKEQIEAELDFIAYLHRSGVGAALPISSVARRLLEDIPFANAFLFACLFEEAEGERFRYDSAKSNKEHFRLRGRTLGQIHALSKDYVPSNSFRRFAWNEDKLLFDVEDFLPKSEKIVWQEYDALKERLRDYPKSNQTFGLIHGDFGETNYRYQDARLNIFDFDDCCYHWFAYDVAITIYPHGWRKEGLQLLEWLIEGYSENMPLSVTFADLTMFCQWRLLYMFLVYARRWGFENLSEQQAIWFAQKRENLARGYQWCS
ncbi:MAG: phosphotransferase [Pyrinomonadaceae bacterium]|nr:phosphotransferase [Pyrinomonadaceae bacterium]